MGHGQGERPVTCIYPLHAMPVDSPDPQPAPLRPSLFIQAPAKVNLALAVSSPIPQGLPGAGLHPIASWMTPVSLFDDLTLTRLPDDYFSRYAIIWAPDARRKREVDWSITRDLAVRAHLKLQEHVGRTLPVQLKLEKRIPVASGLGGGSSDAAAMLLACNALFGLGLSLDVLASIASSLGSDVPFFIHRRSALVEGLGERMTFLSHTDPVQSRSLLCRHAVLLFPEFECPTGHVYRAFDADPAPSHPHADFEERAARIRSIASDGSGLDPDSPFNDLTCAAGRVAPALPDLIGQAARIAERPAHLTGSGSAFFVLCDDSLHAEYLGAALESRIEGLAALPVALHHPHTSP